MSESVNKHLPVTRVTPDDAHYFFGYFDRSPWPPPDGRRILAHRVEFTGRQPKYGERAQLGIVENGSFIPVAETLAWCWQLGSHLQWLDNDRIIYNDVEGDNHVSRILNLRTGNIRIVDRPIYCLIADRKYALSVNFSRLDRERPGYGYPGLFDPTIEQSRPDFDGIWLLDLENNTSKLIISLQRIVEEFPGDGTARNTANWFNHLLFSPNGERFGFIHRDRIYLSNDVRSYVTRLFTAGRNGENIWELPVNGHASHYTWRNDRHIIAHSRHLGSDNYFHIFRDRDGNFCETVAPDLLPTDGHCSFDRSERWLLTDSYPTPAEERTLHLFDTAQNQAYEIGSFKTDNSYPHPTRCDLHPRWNAAGDTVCIDSIHERRRGIYFIDTKELTNGN